MGKEGGRKNEKMDEGKMGGKREEGQNRTKKRKTVKIKGRNGKEGEMNV